jgi:hypothetical protein
VAKIPVTAVYLHRAEGLTKEIETLTVHSLNEADEVLRRWARTAPRDGSVHKTDFQIKWADGQTYSGHYGLKRDDTLKSNLIGSHIQHELAFYAGIFCPQHLSRKEYETVLNRFGKEKQEDAMEFLHNYDM